MNIYNKVTLSVILVITILLSFTFYFLIKKINLIKMIYMKIRLLTVNQQHLVIKKRMVSLQTMRSQHV